MGVGGDEPNWHGAVPEHSSKAACVGNQALLCSEMW